MHSKGDAEYVARMEMCSTSMPKPLSEAAHGVLPESPTQLIGEVRQLPRREGWSATTASTNTTGTANLFVFLDAHRSWREVKVTERRAAQDFAHCMRDIVDIHYPQAERVRVVLDTLSNHTPAALIRPCRHQRRDASCDGWSSITRPNTPDGLNMVEIEIGVLRGQCLDRRIDSYDRLVAETAAWEHLRNTSGARINWMFSTEQARLKLAKAYPKPTAKES